MGRLLLSGDITGRSRTHVKLEYQQYITIPSMPQLRHEIVKQEYTKDK
jgi:hypothetical protein